jgi:hypothetical protein
MDRWWKERWEKRKGRKAGRTAFESQCLGFPKPCQSPRLIKVSNRERQLCSALRFNLPICLAREPFLGRFQVIVLLLFHSQFLKKNPVPALRLSSLPPFTISSGSASSPWKLHRQDSEEIRPTQSYIPKSSVPPSYCLRSYSWKSPITSCTALSLVEEFPAQPATLVNWPPLYIVPTMTLIHKSKYIFGILGLFLTRFLDFSNFQARWKYSKFLVYLGGQLSWELF